MFPLRSSLTWIYLQTFRLGLVGRRGYVALRDELLGGPVGEQRLDFRTVLVQLAFTGAFRPSDRQDFALREAPLYLSLLLEGGSPLNAD